MYESHEERGDKESPKACICLKSCESLYTCPHAPSYRETKDFYIPRLPSSLENIPSVNMFMNVFYIPWFAGLISYIYKLATSSHFKIELFEMVSLTWLPRTFEVPFMNIITYRYSRTQASWNSRVRGFMSFTRFQSSWNKQQICEPKPNSAITSWNIRRLATRTELIRMSFMNIFFLWIRVFHL
jgi:hypothetical protein